MQLFATALLVFTACQSVYGNYMDINECFIELPNFQLTVDAMAVESVEFKDDCLRACLRSYLRGKTCAGLEHRPKDNACVLSERTGERKSNGENKKGSYFENVCARPQAQKIVLLPHFLATNEGLAFLADLVVCLSCYLTKI
ncbi:hypothetical protein Q1695_015641 [Nippostrongylus brasiliensis]|nr:hypothetical protein Q1695_015641 [Nippostrongylus brasiliensis]